jgi:hypothetical protein
MGFVAAHYAGYQEVTLLPPCVCFHIEHGIGSGWTPEGEKALFSRLRQSETLNPEWPVLTPLVEEMREQQRALEFNNSGWGMADFELHEQPLGVSTETPADTLNPSSAAVEQKRVSAIRPEYDLDRLTLAHERRASALGVTTLANQSRCVSEDPRPMPTVQKDAVPAGAPPSLGAAMAAQSEKLVLYIPDSSGDYSEARAIAQYANLVNKNTVIFLVEEFVHRFPLRLDPCQCAGLISIESLAIIDACS